MTHPILRHQVPSGATAATVTVRSPRFDADDPAAPVYTVKVPTRRDKIELHAALHAEGLRYPSDEELRECAKADLRANAAGWEEHVAAIDEFADQTAALARITEEFVQRTAAVASEVERERLTAEMAAALEREQVSQDLLDRFNAIIDDVRRNCTAFRRLEADRQRYMSMVGLVFVERFLLGWTGLDLAFRRAGGVVPEDLLSQVPDDDLRAVGGKVSELLNLTKAAEKNSVSPSASSSDRSNSTSGGKRRTTARGKSTASATRSTRVTKSTRAG